MTRRTFTQVLVAGAGTTSATIQAAIRLNIGIGTYTYHGISMDGMIARLTALGITKSKCRESNSC